MLAYIQKCSSTLDKSMTKEVKNGKIVQKRPRSNLTEGGTHRYLGAAMSSGVT